MFNVVNNQCQQFYDFALERKNHGKDTAIARIGDNAEGATLGERTIVVKSGDRIGRGRGQAPMDVNNQTRALFRKTVSDMFGGEKNIPKSVKDVMLLADYDKGKPLTARRIIKVANAINKLNMANAFEAPGTKPGEMASAAIAAGYKRSDFGKINNAANLYAKGFGVSLKDAMLRILDKTSDANAAMTAGELYMKDVATFKAGVLAHSERAALAAASKTIVEGAVATETPTTFASLARVQAELMRTLLDDAVKLLNKNFEPDPETDPFDKLRTAVKAAEDEFKAVAEKIEKGEITTEKDLCAKVIDNPKLTPISTALEALVRAYREAAKNARTSSCSDMADHLFAIQKNMEAYREGLNDTFKVAFAKREAPRALAKIETAKANALKNTGKPLSIPKQIMDGIEKFLFNLTFDGVNKIDRFCQVLGEQGDATLHFTDDQKARLTKLLTDAVGAERAKLALPRMIAEVECAIFNEFLNGDAPVAVHTRTEALLEHFENNPEMLKIFNVGFDMSKKDQVKGALKARMDAEFADTLNRKQSATNAAKSMYVYDNDILPLGLREYSKGYVTFNGQEIHDAKTDKAYFGAMSQEQQGYAEFLAEKFPESHTKMRKLVSFLCGMSVGIGGAIEVILKEGKDDESQILASIPRDNAIEKHKVVLLDRNRMEGENYDITTDENGDYILTMTHYSQTALVNIIPDGKDTVTFTMMDKQAPNLAVAKIVTTVKITNASDEQLADQMPQFEILDVTQEQL